MPLECGIANPLWHLDMTSVWVAEHGWVYLMAAIDCCISRRGVRGDPLQLHHLVASSSIGRPNSARG
jgi:hypothetical protein